jgi:endonuclease/exonuclease/phosphatase family metal-dependent hydrolase
MPATSTVIARAIPPVTDSPFRRGDPQARIDYVFASGALATTLRSSGIGEPTVEQCVHRNPHRSVAELLGRTPIHSLDGEASDHLPVWADFEWDEAPV